MSNDFQVVSRRKKHNFKSKNRSLPQTHLNETTKANLLDLDKFLCGLATLKHEQTLQELCTGVTGCVSTWKSNCSDELKFVCYGLGKFVSSVDARYQLAVLVVTLEKLKIPFNGCFCYDPQFSSDEKLVLERLGFSLMMENEEGKHKVTQRTVFFMPHCGKALYNNLLWSNWSSSALRKIMIIGNSFNSMKTRVLDKVMIEEYKLITKIIPHTTEQILPLSTDIENFFSDTVLMSFHELKAENEDFWNNVETPCYSEDVEIILKAAVT